MFASTGIRLRFSDRVWVPSRTLLLILSLFLCLFQLSASVRLEAVTVAEEENPVLEAGLRALRDGDVPLAVTLLRSSADTEEDLSAEAWVGLGVAYQRMGRQVSSLAAFSRGGELLAEPLRGWVRYVQGQVLLEAGRTDEADSLLVLLTRSPAEGPLRESINQWQLRVAVERGEQEREVALLREMIARGEGNTSAHAVRLAEIVEEEDAGEAFKLRTRALALPGSDEARGSSAEQLLTAEEHLEADDALATGRALFDLADWSGAERAFRLALERAEAADLRLEAQYRLGISLFRRRAYREASRVLSTVEEVPGRYRTTAAYYNALAIAASSGRRRGAEALVAFADRYPHSQWAVRALREAGERLIDTDYAAAREVLTRLVTEYPTHWENADILFRLGCGARDEGDLPGAQQWYVRLGQGVFHPHEKARGWYWAGRVAEVCEDSTAAVTYYSRAGDRYPDTYYGAQALLELGRALPEPIQVSKGGGGEIRVPEWAEPALAAAIVLLRVGLRQEGELQLLHAVQDRSLIMDRLYRLWELSVEGRAFSAAARLGERLLNGNRWDGDDPRYLELAYPLYYADVVVPEARGHDLDPLLVFALIKQESAFVAEARSYVGARGLMQLMPATAEEWTRRLRRSPVEDEDLYDPEVNLRLGIPYLARLVRQFDGSIEKALAAYNAGAANVRRWERALPDNRPETFLESIGFLQTRTFVRTILDHYYRYRYLWSRKVEG